MADRHGYTVLERYPVIDYALIDRGETCRCCRFVAVWCLNEDDPTNLWWSQGHYFETLYEANKYISDMLTSTGNIADLEAEFADEITEACGIIGNSDPWDDYDRDYTGINPY